MLDQPERFHLLFTKPYIVHFQLCIDIIDKFSYFQFQHLNLPSCYLQKIGLHEKCFSDAHDKQYLLWDR